MGQPQGRVPGKARVALGLIRGERTLSQLASRFHAHPARIGQWRRTALEQMAEIFVDGRKRKPRDGNVVKDTLYEEIGRLKVKLDWLKIRLACSSEQRHLLVEPLYSDISVLRQCQLLRLNRSGLYHQPAGAPRIVNSNIIAATSITETSWIRMNICFSRVRHTDLAGWPILLTLLYTTT